MRTPSSCPRLGKLFRGCKFEPRYHTISPTSDLVAVIHQQWSVSETDKDRLVVDRTYVHDVCVRCGTICHRTEGHAVPG